eukprot:3245948-Pyramimonas_sp.AAC.1
MCIRDSPNLVARPAFRQVYQSRPVGAGTDASPSSSLAFLGLEARSGTAQGLGPRWLGHAF